MDIDIEKLANALAKLFIEAHEHPIGAVIVITGLLIALWLVRRNGTGKGE